MFTTVTYWPPQDGWDHNVTEWMQGIWVVSNGNPVQVQLSRDVVEGGYLYNGATRVRDPRTVQGAMRITKFLTRPNLRTLKQDRVAILEEVELIRTASGF